MSPSGVLNGRSVLDGNVVLECRCRYARRGQSIRYLARLAGVSESAMRRAVMGVTWKHVVVVSP